MKGNLLASMLLASGILLASQTYAQSCCEPTVKDFPKVGGNYGNQNYSSLAQVNKGNIAALGGAWHDHLEGGSTKEFQQATAVAVVPLERRDTSPALRLQHEVLRNSVLDEDRSCEDLEVSQVHRFAH